MHFEEQVQLRGGEDLHALPEWSNLHEPRIRGDVDLHIPARPSHGRSADAENPAVSMAFGPHDRGWFYPDRRNVARPKNSSSRKSLKNRDGTAENRVFRLVQARVAPAPRGDHRRAGRPDHAAAPPQARVLDPPDSSRARRGPRKTADSPAGRGAIGHEIPAESPANRAHRRNQNAPPPARDRGIPRARSAPGRHAPTDCLDSPKGRTEARPGPIRGRRPSRAPFPRDNRARLPRRTWDERARKARADTPPDRSAPGPPPQDAPAPTADLRAGASAHHPRDFPVPPRHDPPNHHPTAVVVHPDYSRSPLALSSPAQVGSPSESRSTRRNATELHAGQLARGIPHCIACESKDWSTKATTPVGHVDQNTHECAPACNPHQGRLASCTSVVVKVIVKHDFVDHMLMIRRARRCRRESVRALRPKIDFIPRRAPNEPPRGLRAGRFE